MGSAAPARVPCWVTSMRWAWPKRCGSPSQPTRGTGTPVARHPPKETMAVKSTLGGVRNHNSPAAARRSVPMLTLGVRNPAGCSDGRAECLRPCVECATFVLWPSLLFCLPMPTLGMPNPRPEGSGVGQATLSHCTARFGVPTTQQPPRSTPWAAQELRRLVT